jgi:DNA-binding response OmpR family regulator
MFRRREVEINGHRIGLLRIEAEVLSILLISRGRPVSMDGMIAGVYGDVEQECDHPTRRIWEAVASLRRLLGRDAILTVNRGLYCGQGYLMPLPDDHLRDRSNGPFAASQAPLRRAATRLECSG